MRLPRPRLHAPTLVGRIRSDPVPLLLMLLVVALTTALTSAVDPVVAHTSDRALADVVRRAGPSAQVVATFPRADVETPRRVRDPRAVAEFRIQQVVARQQLSRQVAAEVAPGVASITTPALQVLGAGPGRYLALSYLDSKGPPRVRFVAGGEPRPESSPGDPRSVDVALSRSTASALRVRVGDRLTAQDDQARVVAVRVAGIFVPDDASDPRWRADVRLLDPTRSVSEGVQNVVASALVLPAALPDLRLAVPADDVTERVGFTPRPARMHWRTSVQLVRAIGRLKASPTLAYGKVAWDSALDQVLTDGRAQVAAARGQADVLLVGLLACALLVLCQVAGLLVHRRTGSVVLTRERGGTLLGVAVELFLESAVFAGVGAVLGLVLTWCVVGDVGGTWWRPVPFVAALAAGVAAAVVASSATDPRRSPANRTARRRVARALRARRLLILSSVTVVAALTFVALRQRGVVEAGDGGDPTATTAPMWWAVTGALLLSRAVPFGASRVLAATRRTTGGTGFFVAARVSAGTRALPLVVVTVTVAQLVLALALSSTEHRGQAAGALLGVGGDARITLPEDGTATGVAREVVAAPGVRAAVAARVEDDVRATSRGTADTVRLVVVDASAYERLLEQSALTDAPQLDRLTRGGGTPALLIGGPAGLRDGLSVRGDDDRAVALRVVGTAPRVQGSIDPVVVVDATRYARAGGESTPDTVWAVGRGAAVAAKVAAGPDGTVALYADVLAARRAAPLASGLVHLATASAVLLALFAILALVMAAAGEAVPRGESLGRLRSLGLGDGQLWRVLAGELAAPAVLGGLVGLALGAGTAVSMFSHLSLERITGQVAPPGVHVPWWCLLALAGLVATVLALTQVEWVRLRRVSLGELLRSGTGR